MGGVQILTCFGMCRSVNSGCRFGVFRCWQSLIGKKRLLVTFSYPNFQKDSIFSCLVGEKLWKFAVF
jgi:hypothetical protein